MFSEGPIHGHREPVWVQAANHSGEHGEDNAHLVTGSKDRQEEIRVSTAPSGAQPYPLT